MDIIELTRELGKAIQADPRFISVQVARQQSDDDRALQDAIGEFNLKRMAINNEATKDDRNEETIKRLNEELRAAYEQIMKNEHMIAYTNAKAEFDQIIQKVTGMLSLIADGEDPETVEVPENCGGNCASCAGCH